MSTLIQGNELRALHFGVRVEKAAFTLPATTSTAIFTVAGGRVIVTSLIGEVTTAVQAQACNLNVTIDPTGAGAAADLVAATEINADAARATSARIRASNAATCGSDDMIRA